MTTDYIVSDVKNIEIWPLDEVKNYLRISHDYDDKLIVSLIDTAIDSAELFTGLSLRTKQIFCKLNHAMKFIRLKYLPILEIEEIILAGKAESNDVTSEFGDITTNTERLNIPDQYLGKNLEIKYQAGYSEVPRPIRQGILMHIAAMYENSEDAVILSPQIKDLYAPYRMIKI